MSADPRLTLAREDLAADWLEGVVRAARFARPRPMRTAAPFASIRRSPDAASEQFDQLLFGETFEVLESKGGFAWGQARRDGYVGFVESAALSPGQGDPDRRICAASAFAYAEPSIKSRPFGPLGLNSLVVAVEEDAGFVRAAGAGWIPGVCLAPIGRFEDDPAAVAEGFVGAPYLWGGRGGLGLDCSGLVQQALYACGGACPRDTDQQSELGQPAPAGGLRRGDLVFWRGHVGMMLDARRLIHANAHHMAVAIEPLAEAIARIAEAGAGEPTAYRRL